MDDEIETLVVRVRADTAGFARDVATMREAIDGPLATGAERAGAAIETTLLRAVRNGRLGFEDLRRGVLRVMDDIAASALRSGIDTLIGGGGNGGGGGGLIAALAGLFGGAPGRATGGPVSPARAYRVGERGPELFVPTSAGQIVPAAAVAGTARDVRVAITIQTPPDTAPRALVQSGRQVARTVRAALERA